MTGKTTASQRPAAAAECGQPRSVRAIEQAQCRIVRSDEPAVVLASLARCSSPSFSDECAIELSEGSEALFQVRFPLPDEARVCPGAGLARARVRAGQVAGETIMTAFRAAPHHGYPAFAGMAVHLWTRHEPGEDDAIIARLLVEHALAIVEQERLAQSAARADERAAGLAIELITSRTMGEAIGLLTASGEVQREEAVRILRRMSRASRREMHEVAADVVHSQGLQRILRAGASTRRGITPA